MGYKIKEKTIKEEVEQNLINKFNSFGLSISFETDDKETKEQKQEKKKEESDK